MCYSDEGALGWGFAAAEVAPVFSPGTVPAWLMARLDMIDALSRVSCYLPCSFPSA